MLNVEAALYLIDKGSQRFWLTIKRSLTMLWISHGLTTCLQGERVLGYLIKRVSLARARFFFFFNTAAGVPYPSAKVRCDHQCLIKDNLLALCARVTLAGGRSFFFGKASGRDNWPTRDNFFWFPDNKRSCDNGGSNTARQRI